MHTHARLAAALACAAALSLATLAALGRPSPAAAAAQIRIADTLCEHADYWAALQVYLRAAECEDRAVGDRARAAAVRTALRVAAFDVAAAQLASLPVAGSRDPVLLALAGDTLWASGRFDEAEGAYRDALAVAPADARARNGLAKALSSRGQHERALDEIQAALRAAPEDPDLLHTLGVVNERMHRYRDAAEAYAAYLGRLRTRFEAEKARWARSHVAFLRSFAGTEPFAMASRGHEGRHVVPFRLVDGKVLIRAKANGKRVDFALDTGAEHTVLSEATARRLHVLPFSDTLSAGVGMVGLRAVQVARLASLQIGTLTVRNLPCLIKAPAVPGLPPDRMEGFSPLDVGLSVSVDYRTRRLTLGDLPLDPRPARELPLRMNGLASVTADVNGTPTSFIVDTGGEGISLSASVARTLFRPINPYRTPLRVWGASGLDPSAYVLPWVNLSFCGLALGDQAVIVLDLRAPSVLLGYEIGGIVGYRFLSRYRVDFDLERSVLRLRDQ